MTNGKGSQRRGSDRASREAYEAGWERIFSGKKRPTPGRRRGKRARK